MAVIQAVRAGWGKLAEAASKSSGRRDAASKQMIETEYAMVAEKSKENTSVTAGEGGSD
jgi:hypothetical protein